MEDVPITYSDKHLTGLKCVCNDVCKTLTCAGFVGLVGVAAVVAVAADADGGGLSCGAAVGRAL